MGLDTVELVLAIEDEFAIRIPDEVAEHLVTVGALHEYVLHTLKTDGRPREPEDVFETIQHLIIRQIGIDAQLITKDANFMQDLGFN